MIGLTPLRLPLGYGYPTIGSRTSLSAVCPQDWCPGCNRRDRGDCPLRGQLYWAAQSTLARPRRPRPRGRPRPRDGAHPKLPCRQQANCPGQHAARQSRRPTDAGRRAAPTTRKAAWAPGCSDYVPSRRAAGDPLPRMPAPSCTAILGPLRQHAMTSVSSGSLPATGRNAQYGSTMRQAGWRSGLMRLP